MRVNDHLNVTVDREGYGEKRIAGSNRNVVEKNVTIYLPTANVYFVHQ